MDSGGFRGEVKYEHIKDLFPSKWCLKSLPWCNKRGNKRQAEGQTEGELIDKGVLLSRKACLPLK